MNERELIDLLDKKDRGLLTESETVRLKEILRDGDAQKFMHEHEVFVEEFRVYDDRIKITEQLDEIHNSIDDDKVIAMKPDGRRWKKYWPMIAVAASVGVVCVLATLMITRTQQLKQEQDYIALRRNVEQIKKSQNEIIKDIKAQNKPQVLPGKYTGTGFLISASGFAVTSYHVVKDADSVYLENEKFGARKASVVYSDAQNDLAILEINAGEFNSSAGLPFLVSNVEADLGEEVYTLGYPREDVVFGEGAVSALSGYHQNPMAYQISIPVNPGNSGGPLLNSKGDLIGVISGLQTNTSGAAFAIKSTVLYNVMDTVLTDSLRQKINLPRKNSLRTFNRVEQIKKWKDFVFMIRVYN